MSSLRNAVVLGCAAGLIACGGERPAQAPVIASFGLGKAIVTAGSSDALIAFFSNGEGRIDPDVGPVSNGKPVSISPSARTIYTLTVTGPGGVAKQSVEVAVVEPPRILNFGSTKSILTLGHTASLDYAFTGGTGSVDQSVGVVMSGGTSEVTPGATADYTLTVRNLAGDSVQQTVTVTVVEPPEIARLYAMSPITIGSADQIAYTFSGGTGVIDHGIGYVTSDGATSVAPTVDTTYTLTVTNMAGDSVQSVVTVGVVPPPSLVSFVASATNVSAYMGVTFVAVYNGGTGHVTCHVANLNLSCGDPVSGVPFVISVSSSTLVTMAVTNAAGTQATASLTVTVPSFFATGALVTARLGHSATRLNDGTVLIAGGKGASGEVLASAEIFDPSTGRFSGTGAMTTGRTAHTATLLTDGTVLVAGGQLDSNAATSSAEIYEPTTGTFTVAQHLLTARFQHTATRLVDGSVLIAGGYGPAELAEAELFDPILHAFVVTGPLTKARAYHAATLLQNGQVMVTGGSDPVTLVVTDPAPTVEIYDPAQGSFSGFVAGPYRLAGVMRHRATMLSGGRVLFTGGKSLYGPGLLLTSSPEIYLPDQNGFYSGMRLSSGREDGDAALLDNGDVLLVGGGTLQDGATGEFYSQARGYFVPIQTPLVEARMQPTATTLLDGSVLVVGGLGASGALGSAEIYR
jgi:hypothetical protein